jgi:hypothetical protein
MSDVCGKVKISPELQRIFNTHFEKIYILHFFYGHIKTYITKRAIEAAIIKHYDDYIQRYWNTGKVPQEKLIGIRNAVAKFLSDFKELSFTDVDLLTQLSNEDINNFPITIINKKPIELED